MTIADKLTQLNTNLGTINTEVSTQEDLITQIKSKINSLPTISPNGPKVFVGTVDSDGEGCVDIPYPDFTPKQILLWNLVEIDQWEETGDDSLVRYIYNGVMLAAVRMPNNRWVSQCLASSSGTIYILQNSAERGPFDDSAEHADTNILDDGEQITWMLGTEGFGSGEHTDTVEMSFKYVLVG